MKTTDPTRIVRPNTYGASTTVIFSFFFFRLRSLDTPSRRYKSIHSLVYIYIYEVRSNVYMYSYYHTQQKMRALFGPRTDEVQPSPALPPRHPQGGKNNEKHVY